MTDIIEILNNKVNSLMVTIDDLNTENARLCSELESYKHMYNSSNRLVKYLITQLSKRGRSYDKYRRHLGRF